MEPPAESGELSKHLPLSQKGESEGLVRDAKAIARFTQFWELEIRPLSGCQSGIDTNRRRCPSERHRGRL